MARMSQWLGLALLTFAMTGCVAQEKYNALKLDRDRTAEALAQAQNEASTARSQADAYKNQLDLLNQNGNNFAALSQNQQAELAALHKQLDELNAKYADAVRNTGTTVILDPELDKELRQFAQQNPDLVDFDSARGIVKFKSDVTFAVGSSDLTPKAKEAIARFSTILNSPAARGYELLVAGHTDNAPVVNAATKSAGHKDNWYLSAHRAISVATDLMSHQVRSDRLGVVGYADQHPIASNASESGKAQNRRVEVLILPTQVKNVATNTNPTDNAVPAGNKQPAGLNKDAPVENKGGSDMQK